MPANSPIYLPYDDYAQSANTLFHFMKKQEYLNSILRRGAIIPRYCVETIDYLSIQNGTHLFNEVAILQKCFCDIPFHKLADSFAVNGVGDVYESLSKERLSIDLKCRLDPIHQLGILMFSSKGIQKVIEISTNREIAICQIL